MQLSRALITRPEPAQVVQPRERALDHPTLFPEPRAVLCAAARDRGLDPALAQLATVLVEVIATVGEQPLRVLARASLPAWHRTDGIHERQELSDIVAMAAGQADRERNPVSVGDQMVL